jgi:hypothetical protein
MSTNTSKALTVKCLEPSQQAELALVCGTSGATVRWVVFVTAVLFGVMLYMLVLSQTQILNTVKGISLGVFITAYTALVINGRLKSGWPTALADNHYLYITYDPAKDEFLRVPFDHIKGFEKKMLYPNSMAVSVLLKEEHLTEHCHDLLHKAIFPAQNAVHMQTVFNNRSRLIAELNKLIS